MLVSHSHVVHGGGRGTRLLHGLLTHTLGRHLHVSPQRALRPKLLNGLRVPRQRAALEEHTLLVKQAHSSPKIRMIYI